MAIRFPREGNEFWPLPPDYSELTGQGRKAARRNVVQTRVTPTDEVISWDFFRRYYLSHDDAHWFDGWVEPSPRHAEWVRLCAIHDRLVIGAHRGSAKSTIFAEMVLRDLVAKPHSSTLLVLSTKTKVETKMDDLMGQIVGNSRIIEDFGTLKPKKGLAGLWNHTNLKLSNGARLQGRSIGSKDLRGERTHKILVDDPEFDPREGTNIDRLISDMDMTLFQVILPMLRKGAKLAWIGTPIQRRLFLWRIVKNAMDDPRVSGDNWFRKIYPGIEPDFNWDVYDPRKIFWPAEYPDIASLRAKKTELGTKWGPEFLCSPASEDERPLEVVEQLNFYKKVEPQADEPHKAKEPLRSETVVEWHDCAFNTDGLLDRTRRTGKAGPLFSQMVRFITADPIRVPGPHSDFAALCVMGIDKLGQRWLLDFWAGKVRPAEFGKQIWRMTKKWHVRVIGCEAISLEKALVADLEANAGEFAMQYGWMPQVVPITYPHGLKKEDRIGALEPYLRKGLLKLPGDLRSAEPFRMLFDQLEYFTPDGANLDHDDAVDALAMMLELTNRRVIPAAAEERGLGTVKEYLDAGKSPDPEKLPMSLIVDMSKVTISQLERYVDKQDPAVMAGRDSRVWVRGGL